MLAMNGAALRTLLAAAEAADPDEACALLVGCAGPGRHFWVSRVEPSPNLAADRRRRFEIDPGLQIGLMRDLRGGPEGIVGVWHSHPDGIALPSATDLAGAFDPALAWVITATIEGRAAQTAAFRLHDDRTGFSPIDLVVAGRDGIPA